MSADDAVYQVAGEVFAPTRWAGSPWSPTMQHGGPINAIFGRAFEAIAHERGFRVARLSIDLFKAVPMAPLEARTRIVRAGRRVVALESEVGVLGADAPICRATGLLLAPQPHAGRHWDTPEFMIPPFEETPVAPRPSDVPIELPPGFHERIALRTGVDEGGPYVWMSLDVDVFDDGSDSPLTRAAALTDLTMGSSMQMAHRRKEGEGSLGDADRPGLLINVDTTVYWERQVVGERLGARPIHIAEQDGIGTAECILYDEQGRTGRALQTGLVQEGMGSGAARSGKYDAAGS